MEARRSDRGREEPLLSRRPTTAGNRRVRSVWQSDSAARETAALSVTAEGHAHTRPPSCGPRPRSEERPYAIFKRRSDLIDRIDNSRGYCPENCRFVTMAEQAMNKTTNVRLEVDGVLYPTMSLAAEAVGVSRQTLRKWISVRVDRCAQYKIKRIP